MAVSDNIKKYRLENKLSQDDLAELCSVARCTVTNWENGRRLPNFDSVKMLAKIFNITMEELIENGKNDEKEKKEAKRKQKLKDKRKKIINIISIIIVLGLLITSLPIFQCAQKRNSFIKQIESINEIVLQVNNLQEISVYKFTQRSNTKYYINKFYISKNETMHYGFKEMNLTNIKILIDFIDIDLIRIQNTTNISFNTNERKFVIIDRQSNNIYVKGSGYYTAEITFKYDLAYIDVLPV